MVQVDGVAQATTSATASQPTGRQRGDGGRPSGNSSSVNVSRSRSPALGSQIHCASQVAPAATGTPPGLVSSP